MMSYEAYIFGWNGKPKGGVADLICCCDTYYEAKIFAQNLAKEYDVIQLMKADGAEGERVKHVGD